MGIDAPLLKTIMKKKEKNQEKKIKETKKKTTCLPSDDFSFHCSETKFRFVSSRFFRTLFPSYALFCVPMSKKVLTHSDVSFLGSGPDRGRSPVEWGEIPFVRSFVRSSVPPPLPGLNLGQGGLIYVLRRLI